MAYRSLLGQLTIISLCQADKLEWTCRRLALEQKLSLRHRSNRRSTGRHPIVAFRRSLSLSWRSPSPGVGRAPAARKRGLRSVSAAARRWLSEGGGWKKPDQAAADREARARSVIAHLLSLLPGRGTLIEASRKSGRDSGTLTAASQLGVGPLRQDTRTICRNRRTLPVTNERRPESTRCWAGALTLV